MLVTGPGPRRPSESTQASGLRVLLGDRGGPCHAKWLCPTSSTVSHRHLRSRGGPRTLRAVRKLGGRPEQPGKAVFREGPGVNGFGFVSSMRPLSQLLTCYHLQKHWTAFRPCTRGGHVQTPGGPGREVRPPCCREPGADGGLSQPSQPVLFAFLPSHPLPLPLLPPGSTSPGAQRSVLCRFLSGFSL